MWSRWKTMLALAAALALEEKEGLETDIGAGKREAKECMGDEG